jgi:hypothetical protein
MKKQKHKNKTKQNKKMKKKSILWERSARTLLGAWPDADMPPEGNHEGRATLLWIDGEAAS